MGKCMATGKETAGKLQNVWLFFRFELPKAAYCSTFLIEQL